ncbi:MAG: hypothetical protein GXO74_07335 [Calditrichaeota bacterium]|nr:hypothetical protein [Calditrichota bacterium]
MRKVFWGMLISLLVLSSANIFAQLKIQQGDELYVKPNFENLRLSPNGSVICRLSQGTKVIALGEQGNWVAVQIVGYIWKGSLSQDRFSIKGYTIRALHILVATEQEAKEIKSLLDGGADFRKLAKERSIGPNAKKGGDLGIITKGDFLPELDSTLSGLKVGEISAIVKTKMGYSIFKRYE